MMTDYALQGVNGQWRGKESAGRKTSSERFPSYLYYCIVDGCSDWLKYEILTAPDLCETYRDFAFKENLYKGIILGRKRISLPLKIDVGNLIYSPSTCLSLGSALLQNSK